MSLKNVPYIIFLLIALACFGVGNYTKDIVPLVSSGLGVTLMAIVLYCSFKGFYVRRKYPLAVCILLITSTVASFGFEFEGTLDYIFVMLPFVGLSALTLVMMIGYWKIRLDTVLFPTFMVMIELGYATVVSVWMRVVRGKEVVEGIIDQSYVVRSFMTGFNMAIILSVFVYIYMKKKGYKLLTCEMFVEDSSMNTSDSQPCREVRWIQSTIL